MASTAEAGRLTEAHRLAQARLGAQTAAQILSTWRLVDPAALDATVEAWLRVAVPIIGAQRTTSARLAANYLTAFRALELGRSARPIVARLAEDLDARQAATSLTVTGPARVKAATGRGVALATASTLGQTGSARSSMRLALDGGRSTISATVAADPQALGWARATSGSPCAFCAMLASRGPAYSEETVAFEAHDGCSCGAEPVYHRDADWPAGARDLRDLWDAHTRGEEDQLNAFRRALAGT